MEQISQQLSSKFLLLKTKSSQDKFFFKKHWSQPRDMLSLNSEKK